MKYKKRFFILTILIVATMIILTCFKFLKQKNYETNVSDVIKIQEESEHFIFYSEEQDRKCLLDLKENLEKNYNKITDDLNTRLN